MLPPSTTCWVLSDGKAGDEVQCVGVAEALGLTPEIRRVAPGAPWVWAMPWGPIPPGDRPGRPKSPLTPPFPDIAIASGRRTVAYLRHLRRASRGRTFTVFLKDPRTGPGTADLIWVPEHDALRGPNVLHTLTSPHRITPQRLAEAADNLPPALAALPRPKAALLLGGDSRHYRFTSDNIARFTSQVAELAGSGVAIMATASRRSPAALVEGIRAVLARHGGYFWDGTGDNPYLALLATADGIVVTADSVNMVGEACATGRPVLVFEPTPRPGGSTDRIRSFVSSLVSVGAVRFFQGRLESYAYESLNSTPVIAAAITAAMKQCASS
jgi:mitochondrial fission protein ELM1